jgi:inhibitor of KinA sporulation pathway (predicted exonuclease)
MGYVVLDMEWNQAMSAKSTVFNRLPIHLRGEVIQIGAVRLTEDMYPGEEFQIDVKPVYFRKMHFKVEKLTGFDKNRLEGGVGFKEAFAKFREWCGEGCTILTWGSDDKPIMEQNIIIHDLDWDWIDRWINLQLIYNVQTQAGRNQTALSTAMEHFEIDQTRIAHDALGDAYNTALVCSKLDLAAGIEKYEEALAQLSARAAGASAEGAAAPVEHKAVTGFATREQAFNDKRISAPACPECGHPLKCARWINQGDRRYMTMASCKTHGKFLIRIRFRSTEEDTWTVNRIIYRADEKMEAFYESKSRPDKRKRRRRKKGLLGRVLNPSTDA